MELGTYRANILDTIGLVPVIGAVKYSDEVGTLGNKLISKGDNVARLKNVAPGESTFWKGLKPYRGKINTSEKGGIQRFFRWDYTHGNVEVFDKNGKHVGLWMPLENGLMVL